jgi:hypothetical protein
METSPAMLEADASHLHLFLFSRTYQYTIPKHFPPRPVNALAMHAKSPTRKVARATRRKSHIQAMEDQTQLHSRNQAGSASD